MQEIKRYIEQEVGGMPLVSFASVYRMGVKNRVRYWLMGTLISLFVILMLPWTQNIRAKGSITTITQDQRPQELNSIIPGKIAKWYVKEGDFVNKGDTIIQLAEIKDAYLDPQLLLRTQEQITAKKAGVASYYDKIKATTSQIGALQQALVLKQRQLSLKVISDSLDVVAATNDYRIAEEQYRRQRIMRDSGLASMVQLEQRNQAYQNTIAKKMNAEVKYQNTRTELSQVEQEYSEKIFKARGEMAAAQSEIAAGTGEIAKISNQFANYTIRNGMYYLVAPQSGQIVQATKSGINEIIKEGEKIVEIIPQDVDYAVELFVRPVDVPLLSKGQKMRFIFDGYPAIVFSGWPQASYGTFSGIITAIESSVSYNGKFRVLISEDTGYKPWPKTLKMGTGAAGIALLKDVQIWYELWRNINGFPPDFYQVNEKANAKK